MMNLYALSTRNSGLPERNQRKNIILLSEFVPKAILLHVACVAELEQRLLTVTNSTKPGKDLS